MATLVTLNTSDNDKTHKGFRLVSEGKHAAEVHRVALIEDNTRAAITFSVTEGADRGLQITQRYSLDHEYGKEQLHSLFVAAGVAPHSEDEFDLDELVGKSVRIKVKHTIKDEKTYANVVAHSAVGK